MTRGIRTIDPRSLAPITLAPSRARVARSPDLAGPLVRLGCALVALALPALGIALADTVHRAAAPRATRAAAPLGGAAARQTTADPAPF